MKVDREKVVLLHSKDKGATGIFDGISAGSTFERVTWVETKERKKKELQTLITRQKTTMKNHSSTPAV